MHLAMCFLALIRISWRGAYSTLFLTATTWAILGHVRADDSAESAEHDPAIQQAVQLIFGIADTDGDNRIDSTEFAHFAGKAFAEEGVGSGAPTSSIPAAGRSSEGPGSDSLSGLDGTLDALDANHDGFLTPEEYAAALRATDRARAGLKPDEEVEVG